MKRYLKYLIASIFVGVCLALYQAVRHTVFSDKKIQEPLEFITTTNDQTQLKPREFQSNRDIRMRRIEEQAARAAADVTIPQEIQYPEFEQGHIPGPSSKVKQEVDQSRPASVSAPIEPPFGGAFAPRDFDYFDSGGYPGGYSGGYPGGGPSNYFDQPYQGGNYRSSYPSSGSSGSSSPFAGSSPSSGSGPTPYFGGSGPIPQSPTSPTASGSTSPSGSGPGSSRPPGAKNFAKGAYAQAAKAKFEAKMPTGPGAPGAPAGVGPGVPSAEPTGLPFGPILEEEPKNNGWLPYVAAGIPAAAAAAGPYAWRWFTGWFNPAPTPVPKIPEPAIVPPEVDPIMHDPVNDVIAQSLGLDPRPKFDPVHDAIVDSLGFNSRPEQDPVNDMIANSIQDILASTDVSPIVEELEDDANTVEAEELQDDVEDVVPQPPVTLEEDVEDAETVEQDDDSDDFESDVEESGNDAATDGSEDVESDDQPINNLGHDGDDTIDDQTFEIERQLLLGMGAGIGVADVAGTWPSGKTATTTTKVQEASTGTPSEPATDLQSYIQNLEEQTRPQVPSLEEYYKTQQETFDQAAKEGQQIEQAFAQGLRAIEIQEENRKKAELLKNQAEQELIKLQQAEQQELMRLQEIEKELKRVQEQADREKLEKETTEELAQIETERQEEIENLVKAFEQHKKDQEAIELLKNQVAEEVQKLEQEEKVEAEKLQQRAKELQQLQEQPMPPLSPSQSVSEALEPVSFPIAQEKPVISQVSPVSTVSTLEQQLVALATKGAELQQDHQRKIKNIEQQIEFDRQAFEREKADLTAEQKRVKAQAIQDLQNQKNQFEVENKNFEQEMQEEIEKIRQQKIAAENKAIFDLQQEQERLETARKNHAQQVKEKTAQVDQQIQELKRTTEGKIAELDQAGQTAKEEKIQDFKQKKRELNKLRKNFEKEIQKQMQDVNQQKKEIENKLIVDLDKAKESLQQAQQDNAAKLAEESQSLNQAIHDLKRIFEEQKAESDQEASVAEQQMLHDFQVKQKALQKSLKAAEKNKQKLERVNQALETQIQKTKNEEQQLKIAVANNRERQKVQEVLIDYAREQTPTAPSASSTVPEKIADQINKVVNFVKDKWTDAQTAMVSIPEEFKPVVGSLETTILNNQSVKDALWELEFKDMTKLPSLNEISNQRRKLIVLAHPDRGGDPEKAKKINAAYDVIKLTFDQSFEKTYEVANNLVEQIQDGVSWQTLQEPVASQVFVPDVGLPVSSASLLLPEPSKEITRVSSAALSTLPSDKNLEMSKESLPKTETTMFETIYEKAEETIENIKNLWAKSVTGSEKTEDVGSIVVPTQYAESINSEDIEILPPAEKDVILDSEVGLAVQTEQQVKAMQDQQTKLDEFLQLEEEKRDIMQRLQEMDVSEILQSRPAQISLLEGQTPLQIQETPTVEQLDRIVQEQVEELADDAIAEKTLLQELEEDKEKIEKLKKDLEDHKKSIDQAQQTINDVIEQKQEEIRIEKAKLAQQDSEKQSITALLKLEQALIREYKNEQQQILKNLQKLKEKSDIELNKLRMKRWEKVDELTPITDIADMFGIKTTKEKALEIAQSEKEPKAVPAQGLGILASTVKQKPQAYLGFTRSELAKAKESEMAATISVPLTEAERDILQVEEDLKRLNEISVEQEQILKEQEQILKQSKPKGSFWKTLKDVVLESTLARFQNLPTSVGSSEPETIQGAGEPVMVPTPAVSVGKAVQRPATWSETIGAQARAAKAIVEGAGRKGLRP